MISSLVISTQWLYYLLFLLGLGNTKRKLDRVLKRALQTVLPKMGLQAEETFIMKCVELAELMVIRWSVFVIGPAGAGKSCIWKALNAAFNYLGPQSERKEVDNEEEVKEPEGGESARDLTQKSRVAVYEVINPKAVQNKELYGYMQVLFFAVSSCSKFINYRKPTGTTACFQLSCVPCPGACTLTPIVMNKNGSCLTAIL